MPYHRRYYRKRRYRPYRPRRRKYGYFGKFGSHVGSAYSMAKKALSLINVEYKYHDVKDIADSIPNTSTIVPLSIIGQGDTSQTRDGDSVRCKRLDLNVRFRINSSATVSTVRVMLVLDLQTNSSQFALSDLLADTSTAAIIMQTPLNLNNRRRFRVWFDKCYTIDQDMRPEVIIKYHKQLAMKLLFDGTAGTIADCPSKSLHLIYTSDEPTNQPTITYYSRLRYIDN